MSASQRIVTYFKMFDTAVNCAQVWPEIAQLRRDGALKLDQHTKWEQPETVGVRLEEFRLNQISGAMALQTKTSDREELVMKKARLATVAIAALAGGAGMASAQGFSLGESYVKGFGGATWPSNFDTTLKEDGEQIASPSFDYETGYILGVAVGAAFTPNISMEIEYAHRSADVAITDGDDDDESVIANGDTSANSLMVNAIYMFDGTGATGAIRPYLGGGIGGAKVETSIPGQDYGADTLLAYQLFGGVAYEMSAKVNLYAEGRWFQTESDTFDGPGGDNFEGKFKTFDLLVGLRYDF